MVEIKKRRDPFIETLKEKFAEEEECEKDWRTPIKEALLREGTIEELKSMKDYVLMKGELYCRMLGGILSRCIGHRDAQEKLEEVHSRTCGFCREICLCCRL